MQSTLTQSQTRTYGPIKYADGGGQYRITAKVRYDDQCGNGHNSFSITGDIDRREKMRWRDDAGGCIHEEIAKHFPDLIPLIKWHGCSSDGPMYYLVNTQFLVGERDCWGLLAGESRQLRNGKTNQLAWKKEGPHGRPSYMDADEQPEGYVAWCRIGDGKPRQLDAARRAAIWPDATDEELIADGLAERLAARLPALLEEFRFAVESIGFTF